MSKIKIKLSKKIGNSKNNPIKLALMAAKNNKYTKFMNALGRLHEKNLHAAYLLVSRLGMPKFNDEIQTARVYTYTDDDNPQDNIFFEFNEEFYESLTESELMAVLLHESLHVLFGHVTNRYGSLYPHYWNHATDAVINDIIAHRYKDAGVVLPGDAIRGETLRGVERNCQYMTAERVYDILIKNKPHIIDVTLDDHGNWNIKTKKGKKLNDRIIKEIEDIIKAAQRSRDPYYGHAHGSSRPTVTGGAGRGSAFAKRKYRFLKPTISPKKLIKDMIHSVASEYLPAWTPPNPKLITLYPNIVIPRWDQSKKAKVLFAIDASGSVSDYWISMFVSIIRSTKNMVKSDIVSFDEKVFPFTRERSVVTGGGGTNPDSVEEYIKSKNVYPENVVCMTDGWFWRKPKLKHPERWLFLVQVPDYNSLLESDNKAYLAMIPDGSRVMLVRKGA